MNTLSREYIDKLTSNRINAMYILKKLRNACFWNLFTIVKYHQSRKLIIFFFFIKSWLQVYKTLHNIYIYLDVHVGNSCGFSITCESLCICSAKKLHDFNGQWFDIQ